MYSQIDILKLKTIAVVLLLMISSCSKAAEKLEQPSLNLQATRLAIIPEKQEAVEFYFSEDGRHVAYTVKRDGKVFLIYDGKESQRYDDLHRIVFSPDGRTVAFRRMNQGSDSVVINGKEEKPYQSIGDVQFAPDGRVVYEAQQNDKWRIVAGRVESPVFDMPYAAPIISPDGKQMAYIEQHYDKKKSNIMVCALDMTKCTKGKDYDLIVHIRKNSANSRIGYVVNNNSKMAVVTLDFSVGTELNEKESPYYDEVFTMEISAGGDHLAYLARREKSIFLVKDGVEMPFPEHERRSHLVIAKNGRTFNIGVLKDRFFAISDGKKIGKNYDEMTMPVFDSEGTRLAYAARRGNKWFVVVNGTEGSAFDMVVTPKFSPDGSRLIYRVRQQGARFVVIADTQGRTVQEHPHYEAIWEPVFSPDGKSVAYGVKTGQELWWRVEPLK